MSGYKVIVQSGMGTKSLEFPDCSTWDEKNGWVKVAEYRDGGILRDTRATINKDKVIAILEL